MKVLFVNPADKGEDFPRNIPFEIGSLAAIADSAGHKLDVMDLNAYREMNTNEAILDGMKYVKETVDYDLVWVQSTFRTLAEAKRVITLIRGKLPEAVMAMAGSASTAMPREVLKIVPDLDLAVFGDQEETFLEVVDQVPGQRWSSVKGVAYRDGKGIRQNVARPAKELDGVTLPKYRFIALDRYFQFSPLPICQEAIASKRRLSFSWEREGKFPSAKRAVENIVGARLKYAIDFANFVDRGIMSNAAWFRDFMGAYMDEELHEVAAWSCWGDPATLSGSPSIVRAMKDSGCRAVILEVVNTTEERPEMQRRMSIDLLKQSGIAIVLRYVVGAPGQTFDDIVGLSYLSFVNKVDPYEVVQPNLFPDGPYYEAHKQEILEPYDGKLEDFVDETARNSPVNWSGGFDFADVVTLRTFVRTGDLRNLLRFAHKRKVSHSQQWVSHCPVCVSVTETAKTVALEATK